MTSAGYLPNAFLVISCLLPMALYLYLVIPRRFSLRGLLALTTILAFVLGLAVFMAQYKP